LAFILLHLGGPAADALAESAAEQRIAAVIAHVKDHPVNELPIEMHPKEKNVVFSRAFNISLSPYFCWMR
jgi:hypothetical protein